MQGFGQAAPHTEPGNGLYCLTSSNASFSLPLRSKLMRSCVGIPTGQAAWQGALKAALLQTGEYERSVPVVTRGLTLPESQSHPQTTRPRSIGWIENPLWKPAGLFCLGLRPGLGSYASSRNASSSSSRSGRSMDFRNLGILPTGNSVLLGQLVHHPHVGRQLPTGPRTYTVPPTMPRSPFSLITDVRLSQSSPHTTPIPPPMNSNEKTEPVLLSTQQLRSRESRVVFHHRAGSGPNPPADIDAPVRAA